MSVSLEERFTGSMLGLALGDALGARYEGSRGEKLAWTAVARATGSVLRWTDDTQMALGLAESLVERQGLDADDLAKRWADNMEVARGYGPGTRELLRRIKAGIPWREANRSVFPEGSYGNGAAMRAAPLGLVYHRSVDTLRRGTMLASSITHAHPLGIDGALLIARAVALALRDEVTLEELYGFSSREEIRARLTLAQELLRRDASTAEVRRALGNGVLAHESAVTAVYMAHRFSDDFTAMTEHIVELGGDTDTIGAMAGGIFGARNGVAGLPTDLCARLEQRERLEHLARELHELAIR